MVKIFLYILIYNDILQLHSKRGASMLNIQQTIQNANSEYNQGNLPLAKKHTEYVLRELESANITPASPLAMSYFEALSLA